MKRVHPYAHTAIVAVLAVALVLLARGRVGTLGGWILVGAVPVVGLVLVANAWARHRRGDDGQTTGLVALLSVVAFVAWSVSLVATNDGGSSFGGHADLATWGLATIAAGAVVLFLIAAEWSRTGYHLVLLVVLLLTGVAVAEVGRSEQSRAQDRETRATATELLADAREAREAAVKAAASAHRDALATARASFGEAARALRAAIAPNPLRTELSSAPVTTSASSCVPAPPEPDTEPWTPEGVTETLCRATTVLRATLGPWPADPEGVLERSKQLTDIQAELLTARDATLEGAELVRVDLFLEATSAAAAVPTPDRTDLPSETEIRGLASKLCAAGAGKFPEPEEPASDQVCRPTGRATKNQRLTPAQIEKELALLIAKMGDDPKATATAEAAWRAAAASADAPAPGVRVDSLLSDGAAGLFRAIPLAGDSSIPNAMGTVGVALLAFAALGGLRALEALNSDRGPSTIRFGTFDGAGDDKKLEPLFKRTVLLNVPEPSAVPGGSAATELTNLVDAAGIAGGFAKSVATAVKAITAISSGTEVDATYRSATLGGEDHHEVFVRLRAARTGRLIGTHLAEGSTAELAVRSAAYWAAATVLRGERTRPSWLQWTDSSSAPLAIYDQEGLDADEQLASLEDAVKAAPTSGVVLLRLSNAYDVRGRYADALEMSLRAATCHPRYPEALYRLAASLSNLADQPHATWLTIEPEQRARMAAAAKRFAARDVGRLDERLFALPDGADRTANQDVRATAGRMLAAASVTLHDSLLADLGSWKVAWRSLRRAERSYWLRLLVTRDGQTTRSQMVATVAAGKPIAAARVHTWASLGGGTDPSRPPTEGEDRAADHDAVQWWQATYNRACYYAIRTDGDVGAHRTRAIELLEATRDLPGAGDLTSGWASVDPDLRSLRPEPRFAAFVATLREETDP